ncbi:hypothetical protein ACIQBJ_05800 [Kitasatospora sp. NPDC088391]|uniref:hypothetical protein n=1 Tax=Kitasatospora sp. NPDC088391 TaxID=3364074 RepID=UPI0038147775
MNQQGETPDPEDRLPLHFDHPFQVWSYSKSHQKLVLRGKPGPAYDRFVDVTFLYVLGMKLASSYPELSVRIADDPAEMAELLQPPPRPDLGFLNLEVSGGGRNGFVVCSRVLVRHGTGWQTPA